MQLELKFFISIFPLVVFILLNAITAATAPSELGSNETILRTGTVSGEKNEDDDPKMSAETRALTSYILTDESWDYERRGQTLRDQIGLVYL
jgi:hypothetical protein